MKLNIPVDSIEGKYLTPDLRKKINGSEQIINNYITNNQITNINGVVKAKCIATTNISLNNTTAIIDDYTCLNNDIILVVGQTDKTENGLYRYDTTFIRYDFEAGDLVAVLNGTNYANSLWKNSNNELVIGTTLIDFEQIHIINVLNDITDVNIDTPINNEVLTYKDGEWVNLPVESLPAGTVNQTLRHDGTDWVANDILKIIDVSASNKRALFDLYSVGNAFVITNKELTGTFTNCLQLQLDATATTSRNLIYANCNSVHRFNVNSFGTIFSNSLTANTYLGANSSKEIVSIASPNLIKSGSSDITDSIGTFRDGITSLGFSTDASVVYELTVKLAFGNVSSRNGSVRMYADGTNFTFRPFIMGNFSGAAPDVIYQNDSTATQPFNMDNGNPLTFQTTGTNSIYELKGIFLSSSAIPNLRLQFKTDDIGLPLVLKGYSYMKISR